MNPKFRVVYDVSSRSCPHEYFCELLLPINIDLKAVFCWLDQKQAGVKDWGQIDHTRYSFIAFLTADQRLIKTLEDRCEAFSSLDELPGYQAWEEGCEEGEDEEFSDPYYEEVMTQLVQEHTSDSWNYAQSQSEGWFYPEPDNSYEKMRLVKEILYG